MVDGRSISEEDRLFDEAVDILIWIQSDPDNTVALDIARSITLPSGPGYIWVAGEAKVTAAIRDYLKTECNVPKERITAIGYWVLGKARD